MFAVHEDSFKAPEGCWWWDNIGKGSISFYGKKENVV